MIRFPLGLPAVQDVSELVGTEGLEPSLEAV